MKRIFSLLLALLMLLSVPAFAKEEYKDPNPFPHGAPEDFKDIVNTQDPTASSGFDALAVKLIGEKATRELRERMREQKGPVEQSDDVLFRMTVAAVEPGATIIRGTGVTGAVVTAEFTGGVRISTSVLPDGTWSLGVPAGMILVYGQRILFEQTLLGELIGMPLYVVVGEGPSGPSATPSINPLSVGNTHVTGLGVPGARISIAINGASAGSTTVGIDGAWSIAVPAGMALANGDLVSAVQTEPDMQPSTAYTATVGGGHQQQSEPPIINTIAAGARSISGRGVPGATITLILPGSGMPSGTVTSSGTWTIAVPGSVTLAAGDDVFATQMETGKLSSAAVGVRVEGTQQSAQPSISAVRAGASSVSGTGVSGAVVTVTFPGGSTQSGAVSGGLWTVSVPGGVTLSVGDTITAIQTETGKTPSSAASTTVLGSDASAAPTINLVRSNSTAVTGSGVNGAAITVTFPGGSTANAVVSAGGWIVSVPSGVTLSGGDTITAVQTETGKTPSSPASTTVVANDTSAAPAINTVRANSTTVTGTGVDGASITVTFPGGTTQSATVSGGSWLVSVPGGVTLSNGDTITAVQTETGKAPSSAASTTVQATDTSAEPVIHTVYTNSLMVSGTGVSGAVIMVTFPGGQTQQTSVSGTSWAAAVPSGVTLAAGDTITARQTETGKTPATAQTTVQAVKSPMPTIASVAAGDTTITGTGVTGGIVLVTLPGGNQQQATVAAGAWSVAVPNSITLAAGDVISAVQTVGADEPSEAATTTVGANQSAAPTINNIYTTDTTVSGTGIAGSAIDITFPNDILDNTTVTNMGTWSASIPQSGYLLEGARVEAVQTEVGKTASNAVHAIVQQKPQSAAPSVNAVYTNSTTVRGTGVDGATVRVTFSDGVVEDATVAIGVWSVTVPSGVTLTAGQTLTITQTEPDKAPTSTTTTVVQAPSTSAIPGITPVYTDDENIGGTGVSGASIEVQFPGRPQGETTSVSNGLWLLPVPADVTLAENDTITVTQTETGKLPAQATATVQVRVPSQAPTVDAIYPGVNTISGSNGVIGSTLTVEYKAGTAAAAEFNYAVTQADWAIRVSDEISIEMGDVIRVGQTEIGKATAWVRTTVLPPVPTINPVYEGDTSITGTCISGATVLLTLHDGTTVYPAVSGTTWSINIEQDTLEAGDTISARQTVADIGTSQPAGTTVIAKSAQPTVDTVRVGDVAISGTGVSGATIRVNHNTVNLPATVNAGGTWSMEIDAVAVDDTIIVYQTEEGKGVSAPVNVAIQDAAQVAALVVNPVVAGDGQLSGTGEPGTMIAVYSKEPNTFLGSGTVNVSGTWIAALPDGRVAVAQEVLTVMQGEAESVDVTVGGTGFPMLTFDSVAALSSDNDVLIINANLDGDVDPYRLEYRRNGTGAWDGDPDYASGTTKYMLVMSAFTIDDTIDIRLVRNDETTGPTHTFLASDFLTSRLPQITGYNSGTGMASGTGVAGSKLIDIGVKKTGSEDWTAKAGMDNIPMGWEYYFGTLQSGDQIRLRQQETAKRDPSDFVYYTIQ